MGVRDLARFLATNCKRAWKQFCEVKGTLVIDGNQLCYQLYCSTWSVQLDWVNGGQYPEYYQQIRRFFEALRRNNIQPHVVFDGVEKTEKLTPAAIMGKMDRREESVQREIRKRPVESTNGAQLPHLAYFVFHNALRDMNVPMYAGNGEGDETCVWIANSFECPVLSDDSDFFLFNLTGGYIQLADLNWQEKPITAKIYHRSDLFSLEFFKENDAWFLIPAILGNGIVPSLATSLENHMLQQLGQSKMDINVVKLCYIYMHTLQLVYMEFCIEHISDKKTRDNLNVNIENVKAYYNTDSQLKPSVLLKAPLPSCPSLPSWFTEEYRKHNIPNSIMDAKVNGRQHHSSSLTSLHIRQCTYRILGKNEVKEYHMVQRKAFEVPVTCTLTQVRCPSLDQIPLMMLSDRQAVLFSILGCTPANLESAAEEDKLFLCSVIFWKRKRNVELHIVKALLACFVQCSTNAQALGVIRANSTISEIYRQSGNWLQDRESFLEWQCVYKDIISLNNVLKCPLQEMCPSRIYDGKIAMSLASCHMNIDNAVRRLSASMEKYTRLINAIQRI